MGDYQTRVAIFVCHCFYNCIVLLCSQECVKRYEKQTITVECCVLLQLDSVFEDVLCRKERAQCMFVEWKP